MNKKTVKTKTVNNCLRSTRKQPSFRHLINRSSNQWLTGE